MASKKRTEITAELQDERNARRASERKQKKLANKVNQLEKLLRPIEKKARFWAESNASDDHNAARMMTVGECRQLVRAIDEAGLGEEEETEEAASDSLSGL